MADARKIVYVKRKNIDLKTYQGSEAAIATINSVGLEDNLVLRLRINSPVFIEAAELLTKEGIAKVITPQ